MQKVTGRCQIANTIQPVHAVMSASHPLAELKTVRLRNCLQYPIALPSANYGVRNLLEIATRKTSFKLNPMVESDSFEFLNCHALVENILTFQIQIAVPAANLQNGLKSVPIDTRDVPPGLLYVGQMQNRILPVAASRFADQIINSLVKRFDCE